MGNPGTVKGLVKDALAIDYDGFDALGIKYPKSTVALVVRKARNLEIAMWYWKHPDINTRVNARIAMSGWIVGFIGLVIGLTSIL